MKKQKTKNKMDKILQRSTYTSATLHVREAAEGGASRIIEGYAVKFGVRSRLLSDMVELYYETLELGSITREMLDEQDIRLTLFHDCQLFLARSKNGEGTLHYEVDDIGVKFWAEMPNTSDGDKALELVRRGDIDGCSFMYATDERDKDCVDYELVEEGGESFPLRHVKRVLKVRDFTLTPYPAYEQTEVVRRDMENAPGVLKPEVQSVKTEAPRADEAHKREVLREYRERINSRLI